MIGFCLKKLSSLIDNEITNVLFEPKAIKIVIENLKKRQNTYSQQTVLANTKLNNIY